MGASKVFRVMPRIIVEKLELPREAYDFLARDRIYAAYAIGSLATEKASCTVLRALRDREELSLALISQPIDTIATMFLMGDTVGLHESLRAPFARIPFALTTAKEEHLACLRRYWRIEEAEMMLRMVVDRGGFRPPAEGKGIELRRLAPPDAMVLAETYEMAFGGTPSLARLMERGPYFGVWDKGRLNSVAGTHFIAEHFRLAAAGNVWTRNGFRGKGLATLTLGKVTQELLEQCEEVVLNVREDNAAARRVYEKLGFRMHCRFRQVRAKWRL